ncbi:MAG TPA: nucleotidyltransferase family protein [Gallionella sp.]
MAKLPLIEWDLLVRQARSAELLGRIAVLMHEADLLDAVPSAPRAHLESALVLSSAQSNTARREVNFIQEALQGLEIDTILLKGAAYVLAKLPAAKGRFFSDVDILVPCERLPEVEAALMLNGWATTHHAPYDQRYYRQWMHELPPMQHIKRNTVIDVHHSIVPITARIKLDASKLLASAKPVEGLPGLRILAPADMVLHSATHLFFNEELSHGLRDLSDLDLLLRHFGTTPEFWQQIAERAKEMKLERPLYYCLRNTVRLFSTPIPPSILKTISDIAPPRLTKMLMDRLWFEVLRPYHPSTTTAPTHLARGALYLRAHWLRMPPLLLAYHLIVKSLRQEHQP